MWAGQTGFMPTPSLKALRMTASIIFLNGKFEAIRLNLLLVSNRSLAKSRFSKTIGLPKDLAMSVTTLASTPIR